MGGRADTRMRRMGPRARDRRRGQKTERRSGLTRATCVVHHVHGHSESASFACPIDQKMRMGDMQKAASANTFCKRNALKNAYGLVESGEVDDDGVAADAKAITDEMAKQLEQMIRDSGIDRANLLTYLRAGSVEEIPLTSWGLAKNAIAVFERKKRGAGDATS